ncbi:Response regulator receiver domain-containing protein [Nonlabens sp. Hel1_33_55]|uniref:response regulator n=1 Tax=Nonlabens sp. Hel1_33_55 TaxID=1336802 RepID=UPI000875C5A2|nr:response regulator [Nonlabens sp. Hel1_33_55]SCY26942.1 Response regulator receiver domain-containing protein [Nonlabens sp. Hel1_33_55]
MNKSLVPKVCIIDDDRLYVSLVSMMIKKNSFAEELLVFQNGRDALDYFAKAIDDPNETLPTIILLDLNMPIMNGWEFLKKMEPYANKMLERNIKLNVVSSTINPDEVNRAENHDIVHNFITKPISKDAIASAFLN